MILDFHIYYNILQNRRNYLNLFIEILTITKSSDNKKKTQCAEATIKQLSLQIQQLQASSVKDDFEVPAETVKKAK